jgi:hypothetical protein
MPFPDFFALAPTITVQDRLAAFLGAPIHGHITYAYADAVRLAGHSCPTVAGAWLMSIKAMAALWPDAMPERGAVRLLLPDDQDEGVTGVIAAVAGLVTGAAGPGGFKGIGGRFNRADLMAFAQPIPATLGFHRTDTGAGVLVTYNPGLVPPSDAMRPALQRILAGVETPEDATTFARAWQDRVRRILVEHADEVVTLTPY